VPTWLAPLHACLTLPSVDACFVPLCLSKHERFCLSHACS
jgi:hypothetical protein